MPGTLSALFSVGRGLWWCLVVLLGMAGVAGSYVLMGTADADLLAALAAFLTASAGWMLRSQGPRPLRLPSPALLGSTAAVAALCVAGLILELGGTGLLTTAVVAAIGWAVLRGRRGDVRCDGSRHGDGSGARGCVGSAPGQQLIGPSLERVPQDPLPSLSSLSMLETPELCWTWQLTYSRLCRSRSPAETQYLADLRRGCLVQLERRDPRAFRRWFPSARAASDPARYFCCRPASPPATGDVAS